MGSIEGSGVPVLYIGRRVPKGSNNTTAVHKEIEQLGDRRNAGESSCNSEKGTGQMAQPLVSMMMMMMMMII
jgi:hypothetical protein